MNTARRYHYLRHSTTKNQRECYRVRLTIIDGRPFADLRVYTKTINEELRPTVKGVAIRADALPEVIKALIEAATFIDD